MIIILSFNSYYISYNNIYVFIITQQIVELLDTVFMVLRHKFRQISTLHVYHHASMILLSELGYTKYAWAAFSMPLMLNALVNSDAIFVRPCKKIWSHFISSNIDVNFISLRMRGNCLKSVLKDMDLKFETQFFFNFNIK